MKSGNYLIYDCGANATTVEDELDLLWGYLQDAIADVKAPSTSAAFNAFFKANGDKSMVQKVMKNIADGAAVQMISSFFGETTGTPAIFCYNRNESPPAPVDINNVVSVWRKLTVNVCDDRKRIASWWKSEAWFALCEKYWAKPVEPPVGACFEPDPGQTAFSRNGADIRETRVYTLLHESAHYYIQAATQSNNLIDVYTVDDVIDLTADEARMNAMNYVYYVYCELRRRCGC